MYRSAPYMSDADDDEPVQPFGAGLFSRKSQGSRKTPYELLSKRQQALLPERQAPKWGGERGFSSDIELKLLLGVGAAGGGLVYGIVNLFLG